MLDQERIDELEAVARNALSRWGIGPDASIRLISLSENGMFLVTSGSDRWVMRVHRTGYHSEDAVRSELCWMDALRREANVATPRALPGQDGKLIQTVSAGSSPLARMVVLFDFISGSEPKPGDLHDAFRHLGGMAAGMHAHARDWQRPDWFVRQVWDYEGAFGAKPNWGHWRAGFAADVDGLSLVERADELMRRRLERFGAAPARFGLIHSDLRLANLLVDGGETKVLDFDDCGFGWYMYDVASSMTFLETQPDVEDVIASWIEGYRAVAHLGPEEVAEIPTLMMFRRLVVMGWAGSHPDTDLAREMGTQYSVGTVELAERYLSRLSPR